MTSDIASSSSVPHRRALPSRRVCAGPRGAQADGLRAQVGRDGRDPRALLPRGHEDCAHRRRSPYAPFLPPFIFIFHSPLDCLTKTARVSRSNQIIKDGKREIKLSKGDIVIIGTSLAHMVRCQFIHPDANKVPHPSLSRTPPSSPTLAPSTSRATWRTTSSSVTLNDTGFDLALKNEE